MYRDKESLGMFAKVAADGYLNGGTLLNESLKKVASEEALTPFQIQYVAGEANKAVWSRLFSLDKKASYDFPVADAARVIGELQIKQTEPTLKDADMDYLGSPQSTKVASFDPFAAFGVTPDPLEKTASACREMKHTLQSRMEKLAQLKQDMDGQRIEIDTAIENSTRDFVKMARDMVIELPFEQRREGLEKIADFLNHSGSTPELSKSLIKKLAYVMKHQGLAKEADLKAPEELISDKLPARIINGRHALYITIKTLRDHMHDRCDLDSKSLIVDESLPVLREKIREL